MTIDHDATGPVIEDDKLVCSTCHRPAFVQTSPDMDSAWAEHGDLELPADRKARLEREWDLLIG